MRKLLFGLFVILLSFSFSFGQVHAQEKVNPDSGLSYKSKRFKEKISLFFKFSPASKSKYYETLLDKRLSELRYIVDNKQFAFLETSSQRYESTAGELTEFVITKKIVSEKDELIKSFSEQQKEIEGIRENFAFGTAEWRLIMNDFNSLEIYKNKLLSL